MYIWVHQFSLLLVFHIDKDVRPAMMPCSVFSEFCMDIWLFFFLLQALKLNPSDTRFFQMWTSCQLVQRIAVLSPFHPERLVEAVVFYEKKLAASWPGALAASCSSKLLQDISNFECWSIWSTDEVRDWNLKCGVLLRFDRKSTVREYSHLRKWTKIRILGIKLMFSSCKY